MLEVAQVLRREILKSPDDDRRPKNDRTDFLQVIRHALPYMRRRIAGFGQTELRQLIYRIVISLFEPFGTFHNKSKQHRQAYANDVHRYHDKRLAVLEEGIDKQHVGQTCIEIKNLRPVEPYKGKGIKFDGEYVRRKVGKSGTK